MFKRVLGIALLLALCVGTAVPQGGNGKICIHIVDTLRNVLPVLSNEHGLTINVDVQIDVAEDLAEKLVELHLEDASPLEVVTAICKQIGTVYEHRASGVWGSRDQNTGWWTLRPGDWDADCRPQVRLAEYTVYVRSVCRERSEDLQFRWGLDEPEAEKTDRLKIRLSIKSDSDEAAIRLAGLLREASALTPNGQIVYTAYRIDTDSLHEFDLWTDRDFVSLEFALPPAPTQQFEELRGTLVLFNSVTAVHCEFAPDEIGATKTFGDAECKLLKWQEVDNDTAITVTVEPPGWSDVGRSTLTPELVSPDGKRVRNRGYRGRSNREKWTVTYTFDTPDWPVAKMVIEGFLKRNPDKLVEFTIKDIPLP